MGEKRRWENWELGKREERGWWPAKSRQRWGQQNAGFNSWRQEEGLTKQPSSGCGTCYSTTPSWEKTFCISVCQVPWWKIRDAKRVMSMYKNVAEWDDSAGREAFENAKARYRAKINSLPCNLPLPDPNTYIDCVDFNVVIDPELAEEIDRCGKDRDEGIAAIKLMDPSGHETVTATRWGEAENSSTNWDRCAEKPFATSGWEDTRVGAPANAESGDAWVCATGWGNETVPCDPWSTQRVHSVGINGWRNSWEHRASWKDQKDQNRMDDSWRYKRKWKNDQAGKNNGRTNGRHWNTRYPADCDHINHSCPHSGGDNYEKVQNGRTWHDQHFGLTNLERPEYSQDPWQHKNAVS